MASMKFAEREAGEELMSAALYVEDGQGEEEEDRPPQDGMAYLRAVMKERKQCPDTVEASVVPPVRGRGKGGKEEQEQQEEGGGRSKAPPPPGCCPGVKWQREQVKQFSQVRLRMSQHVSLVRSEGARPAKVPDRQNEALWCHLMLGAKAWQDVLREREEEGEQEGAVKPQEGVEGEQPRLEIVTSIPVHVCETLLEYLVSWLSVTGWSPEFGPWLYSILTRLEKPLTPDVSSVLRDLALSCSRIRKAQAHKAADSTNSVTGDEDIAAMNLFICLVARYFDQGDLVDEEES